MLIQLSAPIRQRLRLAVAAAALFVLVAAANPNGRPQNAQSAPAKTSSRFVGTVASITGQVITLKADAGAEVQLTVEDASRLLQMPPGAKNLSAALPIKLSDIQVGDRVLVLAIPVADGAGYTAKTVVAMKQADIAQKQQHDREDWRARGASGLVKSVDPAAQSITITTGALTSSKPLIVKVSKATMIRRYAADSVKFDDAKPSSFDQIKPGDQLRARGDKSADGNELAAEEIVTGTFRNIAGTVVTVDTSANTATVNDLVTKKPFVVHFNADSQLRNLPPTMAQGIAMRLKGGTGATGGTNAGASKPAAQPVATGAQGGPAETGHRGDLQQMLNRAPALQLSELKPGEAVMVLTTEGQTPEGQTQRSVTAITLLAGVEPLLQASPGASQSVLSASWNLGGAPAGQDAQ